MKVYVTNYFRSHITGSYIKRITFTPHSLGGFYIVYDDNKVTRVVTDIRSDRNADREFELIYRNHLYFVSIDPANVHEIEDLRGVFYRFNIPYTTVRMRLIKDVYTLELL